MTFKKCTTFLLAILLLISNSGLAFNVHYCGDKIAAIYLIINTQKVAPEENCCTIAVDKNKCCADKSFQIQESSDKFQENIPLFEFKQFLLAVFKIKNVFDTIHEFEKSSSSIAYAFLENLPPIFKRNCQLIFYA